VFAHELEHTGGYTPEDAKAVARSFADIASYHPNSRALPQNGRTLTDDVVDLSSLYTQPKRDRHCWAARYLMNEFPYLGPPHNVLKQL